MVSFSEEVNWRKTPLLNRSFHMQLSLIKTHFIYSGGHPGRQKKDCTINSLWEQVVT